MATIKQKTAFNRIIENHGSVSKTMREVGYTKATAVNPKNLTESDGWKELMRDYLPDELIASKHRALLNKEEPETGQPETQAVSKALDMAYKLKDRYPKGNFNAIQINFNQDREKYEADE